MAEKKTLLDLDRLPTLEEMQDFFKENDWSAAKIFTEPELTDAISHGKELLAPVFGYYGYFFTERELLRRAREIHLAHSAVRHHCFGLRKEGMRGIP